MAEKIPAILSWSGGKDCAYALYKVLQEDLYEVKYLLSIFNEETRALNMHQVPEVLIAQQAAQIGIPLLKVFVGDSSNNTYEKQLSKAIEILKGQGIYHIIFGDLFLQDLRQYREVMMQQLGMQSVFPIWQTPPAFLINDFMAKGFKAITCCIDAAKLPKSFIGRFIDHPFVNDLPKEVDPCGENGEYHSFCYDAPYFKNPINMKAGQIYFKPIELRLTDKASSIVQGYWFCELMAEKRTVLPVEKICPNCLNEFECMQADISQCQCYSVVLTPGTKKKLSAFNDCLCKQCLQQMAELK